VTVELPAGRVTTIMAPSGFGKSTLMHCDNSRGVILIAPIGLTLPIVRFPC
jgi:ABC-type cobalamin/Fe3+-siderophores transport system ATPase subunit